MTRWMSGRGLLALVLTLTPLWAPPLAQAQQNSREAIEAVRQHRAAQARGEAAAPQRLEGGPAETAPPAPQRQADRPFSSGADPSADPNRSLKSCLDHVGINPAARDRCMRQHCEGRWGQGDCPAGGDLINRTGAQANTALGSCLREAGANPFKRDACGWRHCAPRWESAECQALRPQQQRAN